MTPRLGPFLDLYPHIKLAVILADYELDLGMREADVALRLREELVHHRLIAYSATPSSVLNELNAPLFAPRGGKEPVAAMSVNNIPALQRAVENGMGIGVLPNYLNEPESGLVQLITHAVTPTLDCYLVFPEAMKNVARVRVFRDFLVASAQRWRY